MDNEALSANTAAKATFLPVLRALVRAYQAFEACDSGNLRRYDLTAPQADIIFTLGNTDGMTFKQLSERTLTTKGTLTGIIDRLEDKGLVKRVTSKEDRRSTIATLTRKGERLFETVFPAHIAHLQTRFAHLSKREIDEIERSLKKLQSLF